MSTPTDRDLHAVLWDFGGVILTSPFEAFNRYEERVGLPVDFIRSVNATDPHANAWARLERSEISTEEFDDAFAEESERLGHRVPGADVLGLLSGEVRSEMVAALDAVIAAGFRTACLTNNVSGGNVSGGNVSGGNVSGGNVSDGNVVGADVRADVADVMRRFHVVVESSKVGVRKPEPRFYELACEMLGVEASRCVFLDDLGINLKPAAAMGMTTIKVIDPIAALAELGAATGLDLV